MLRVVHVLALLGMATTVCAKDLTGTYLETRTCQVYTGPCFANGESGLTGKDAILAWNVETGKYNGVELAGLSVVMVVRSTHTLGFHGFESSTDVKSIVLVDERGTAAQRKALAEFAAEHGGLAGKSVVRVDVAPIAMTLDTAELKGRLEAGREVKVVTRKARKTDCICTNEVAYYPPLAKVDNFAAGVTEEGVFNGRGLGSRWTTPNSRSAYMATFVY